MTPLIHEIKVGAIIGIRVWHIRGTQLCSALYLTYPGAWKPGETCTAAMLTHYDVCRACPGLSAPCISSKPAYYSIKCGIHAVNNLEYFKSRISPYWFSSPLAFGLVRLFGRVVECEYGWRAEKAEVHAIIGGNIGGLVSVGGCQLRGLAETYNIPLLPRATAQELVSPLPGKPSQ